MAGTLFGLSLSQRVDLNGIPAVGWLLYLYQANTSTPVNSYQDTALTVLNPWPLQADAYGMQRQFWLADGSYRARATSQDGSIVYFDQLSILALGASSGAAPSGGVDATAIFQVGDVMWLDRQGTRAGWVRDNGMTIGSATSGASERANADCQPLFEWLWNNMSNTFCPVVGGRGGSSLSDWGANKQITLPDKRDCSVMGLDDMGNASGGHMDPAIIPVIAGGFTTPGSTVGGNHHFLTTPQLPGHAHSTSVTDPQHSHGLTAQQATFQGPGGQTTPLAGSFATGVAQGNTQPASTGISVSVLNAGGDQGHNNTPRAVMGTFYRKL